MPRPGPVPDDLARGPMTRGFLVDSGVSDGKLRSSAYRSPHYGIHVASALPRTTRQRIVEAAMLLPHGGAIGGWAAAHLLGSAVFDGVRADGDEVDVLLCVPRNSRLRDRPGVRLLRTDLRADEIVVRDGVIVTSAVRTGADLARLHPEPRERVVALDALWADGVVTPAEITDYLTTRRRLRGAPVVREAIALARPGVRSPQESRLRWLWTQEAGLPDPLVNERVVDLDGNHLGRLDLLDEEAGMGGEFDGRDHLQLAVTTVDNVRQEGLERHRIIVCRFTGVDLTPRYTRRTVFRLQQARRSGLDQRGFPRTWRVAR